MDLKSLSYFFVLLKACNLQYISFDTNASFYNIGGNCGKDSDDDKRYYGHEFMYVSMEFTIFHIAKFE